MTKNAFCPNYEAHFFALLDRSSQYEVERGKDAPPKACRRVRNEIKQLVGLIVRQRTLPYLCSERRLDCKSNRGHKLEPSAITRHHVDPVVLYGHEGVRARWSEVLARRSPLTIPHDVFHSHDLALFVYFCLAAHLLYLRNILGILSFWFLSFSLTCDRTRLTPHRG